MTTSLAAARTIRSYSCTSLPAHHGATSCNAYKSQAALHQPINSIVRSCWHPYPTTHRLLHLCTTLAVRCCLKGMDRIYTRPCSNYCTSAPTGCKNLTTAIRRQHHTACARGLALRLGICLLGFPAVVFVATPIPTITCLRNITLPHRNLVLCFEQHLLHQHMKLLATA